jgi:cell division protein FtsN
MAATRRPFLNGFLTGLAVGLGLALAVAIWVGFSNPFVEPPAPLAGSNENQATPKEAPSYDFYKTLPDETSAPTAEEAPPAKSEPTYYLQAGAFLNAADAEEMKARLALLGFEASIVQVQDAEAIHLHKVRIGPFKGMDELNKTRARLTQNSIETLLIKVAPVNPAKETP